MTEDRDPDRRIGPWLDEQATPSAPDGLLERSLARVEATGQRPGWRAADRWRSYLGIRRPATVRGGMGPVLAVAVVVVAVAAGAGLYLGFSRGIVAGPSGPPSIGPVPSAPVVGMPASPVFPVAPSPPPTIGPGTVIAYTRTTVKPAMSAQNPGGARCYDGTSCPVPRLWVVGSDGSGAHELLPAGMGAQIGGAWSSDGAHLVYEESGKFYLTDASGSAPQVVDTGCVAPCVGDYAAAFSSDGTHLVFVRTSTSASGYDDHNAITTMDLASGRVLELSSTAPDGGSLPGWSPDGTQIAFFRYGDKDMGIVGPVPVRKSAVFVVDADGGNLHQITPKTLAAQFAGWSPDGARIVFTSLDAGREDVYTVRPDGTDVRRLTTDGISFGATWTPDGRILFVRGSTGAGTAGAPGFWTMGADGTNAAQLAPGMLAADQDPAWTPGPAWQPIGGQSIVPPPWSPSTSTAVGPPPPTPPATPAAALSPGFSWTGSMHTATGGPLGETATLLADGRVLVTGGCSAGAELYDPATGMFSPTGSLTVVRGGATATLLKNGRVLVAGGYNCGNGQNDGIWASAELYDPATGTFGPTGSMGTPREFHTATILADGRVLITGGHTGQSPVASVSVVFASYERALTAETAGSSTLSSAELYDPGTGAFSPTGSMAVFRDRHTATLLENGMVLVAGGGGEGYARNSAELYNPATGTFRSTGSMRSDRWLHSATLLPDGRVLIAGGRSPNDSTYASAELYDPATGRFAPTGSMKASRQEHSATLLADGRVLIAGGYVQDPAHWDVLSQTELYDPRTGKFANGGSMGEPRSGQAATLLNDGRVLIVGGSGVGYPMGAGPTSAVLYQP
jgi:WD40 repeat protein